MRSKMRPICWYHLLVKKSFLETTQIQNFEGCKKNIIFFEGSSKFLFFFNEYPSSLVSFFKGKRVVIFYFTKKVVSKNIELLWFRFFFFCNVYWALQHPQSSLLVKWTIVWEKICVAKATCRWKAKEQKQERLLKTCFFHLILRTNENCDGKFWRW